MSPAPLLEFRDLTFERNDVPLFAGLCGAVCGGDILQILGANGAGKTTLLRVLTTALTPAAGSLSWRGAPLPRQRSRYLAELALLLLRFSPIQSHWAGRCPWFRAHVGPPLAAALPMTYTARISQPTAHLAITS